MDEPGTGGEGPFGKAKGEPERPLLEAFIVFLSFYFASFIFAGAPAKPLSGPAYHLAVLAVNLPRALLVLYIMAVGDGLRPFDIALPRPVDAARGLLCAVGALAVVIVPGLLFSALGIQNPFLAQAGSGTRAGPALFPLILASSMATGYCEELFFRSYLMRRLGQGGMPVLWAAIASSLIFGGGHGYQGVIGLVSGSLLGLFFAWRWQAGKNIHEIAIGHGFFDAAILAIVLYS
jgi:membrane protease YdiL (CAAX protease family)